MYARRTATRRRISDKRLGRIVNAKIEEPVVPRAAGVLRLDNQNRRRLAPSYVAAFNLSRAGDPTEAAARLFAGLRELDALGAHLRLVRIAAMPIPDRGLGLAINDRLRRAAAPRSG